MLLSKDRPQQDSERTNAESLGDGVLDLPAETVVASGCNGHYQNSTPEPQPGYQGRALLAVGPTSGSGVGSGVAVGLGRRAWEPSPGFRPLSRTTPAMGCTILHGRQRLCHRHRRMNVSRHPCWQAVTVYSNMVCSPNSMWQSDGSVGWGRGRSRSCGWNSTYPNPSGNVSVIRTRTSPKFRRP